MRLLEKEPVARGFFRSDIEFASRHEKSPLIFVGIETMGLIKQERFHLVDFHAVQSTSET
jgi:hypothetical protein